ncbi:hypothetical protein BSG1_08636 [Bacillus sp. SG-1]|nr:hypothetical protein BSG1_08636 [Bacillus sp. SG-1]
MKEKEVCPLNFMGQPLFIWLFSKTLLLFIMKFKRNKHISLELSW